MITYCHCADNVAPIATITATPEDAAYPGANLIDGNPGKPSMLSATTGSWVGDLGAATRVDLVALWKHTFDPGLTVQFQMHSANNWAAPTLSTTIVIPALPEDAYPLCPFKDLRTVTGYAQAGLRYFRINVPNANSKNLGIGELFLGKVAKTLTYLQSPAEVLEDHPIVEHETDYKVSLIYDRGVRVRQFAADGMVCDDEIAALKAWFRACRGRARAGLFIPDPAVNDAWFVRFPADGLTVRGELGWPYSTFSLVLKEIGQGLPL